MPEGLPSSDRIEFVTTSKRQRGNRNKSLLLKEKREWLKQKRTNAFKRCDRVNSKEVDQKWIQDRTKKMVIIGSDAISLYPNLTRQESADEVPESVMESDLK